MSAAKHTSGPWRWEFNKKAKSVYLVGGKPRYDKTVMQFGRWGMSHATPLSNTAITGDKYNIMERLCDQPEWTQPFPGLEHHADWRMDVVHPDARLIAAAPELLEALTELEEFYTTIGTQSDDQAMRAVHAKARAAITKATGSTT